MVVVDKPAGWTSHSVVGRVRRLAGTRKVGHAGTLDPMATGVLVVGVNRATRLLGHLALTEKAYTATIRLGVATVTDDAEGEPTATSGAGGVTEPAVRSAAAALTGPIRQVPSAVSAIKVGGVRSYARVRSGEAVDLAARPVTVRRFDVLSATSSRVEETEVLDVAVSVVCSSGTYVRALARDLGSALGTGGHLTALRRTRVGPFDLDGAQTLEQAERRLDLVDIATVARRSFPTLDLDDRAAADVRFGRRLRDVALPDGVTAVFAGPEFLALYRPEGSDAVPAAVFVG